MDNITNDNTMKVENEISTTTDLGTENDSSMIENDNEEIEEGMIIEEEEVFDKSLCQMCKTNKWKYTCPKCLMHTCSLPCVKSHKKEFSCDGKRDKVKYVAMNDYNENNLRNDYYFLEDVARANDNANREQNDFRKIKLSQKKMAILKQAKKKNIILKFMPIGMKKSQINRIYFNIKAKEINWTVELNFPDSEKKLKLIRTRIRDNMKIKDIINNCLCEKEGNAMTRHNLSNYIGFDIENLKVFQKREEIPANRQEYYTVDMNSTISEVLAFKIVIEYPSFFILTPSSTFLDHAKIIGEEEQETLKQEIKAKQEEERNKMKNNNNNNQKNKNKNKNNHKANDDADTDANADADADVDVNTDTNANANATTSINNEDKQENEEGEIEEEEDNKNGEEEEEDFDVNDRNRTMTIDYQESRGSQEQISSTSISASVSGIDPSINEDSHEVSVAASGVTGETVEATTEESG